MDTTIRSLDEDAYRRLKARAAAEGKTIGEAMNEAMRDWASQALAVEKRGSILDLKPVSLGKGSERLSEQIDEIVYGI
ncbi:MAG TPA: hypothetical protein VGB42_06035 [Candidatus Thermoplasmatota archaeon]